MDAGNNAPIIIKRKKVSGGDGHHGGAWKVAYADFVTAMMAFFMLMWLLNATTEQQRRGIADYFTPTIPINRISGGGDGALSGDNIFSTDDLARSGTGGVGEQSGASIVTAQEAAGAIEDAKMQDIEEALLGLGGETTLEDNMLRHIVTRQTDEGLVIEIFDLPGASMFDDVTAVPTPLMSEMMTMISGVLGTVSNDLAIHGHVASAAVVRQDYRVWDLSTDRAATVRTLLEASGTDPDRISRQTGQADREQVSNDPKSIRNNRIELIVLRNDR